MMDRDAWAPLIDLTRRLRQAAEAALAERAAAWQPPRRATPPALPSPDVANAHDAGRRRTADEAAQTAVCLAVARRVAVVQGFSAAWVTSAAAAALAGPGDAAVPLGDPDALAALFPHSLRAELEALDRLDVRPLLAELPPEDPIAYLYEALLARYHPRRRRRLGVFFTPLPLVRLVVASVDAALCRRLGLPQGLADPRTWAHIAAGNPAVTIPDAARADDPLVRILDPAAGSGIFLVECLRRIHATRTAAWQAEGNAARDLARAWRRYAVQHLLPRLVGLELLAPAVALARFRLLLALAETGCRLTAAEAARLRILQTDTLSGPQRDDSAAVAWEKLQAPATVIVGNPPFSGISQNRGDWIGRLLRGAGDAAPADPRASYYAAEGRPLGERKLWLADDYVKFFRYAQWRIERAGCGAMGLVSNHGYLDNPTFRGMRESLLATFDEIRVLDLHGNVKRREGRGRPPQEAPRADRRDQSVFATEQGVAVGLFLRTLPAPRKASDAGGRPPTGGADVFRGDLWGEREQKQARLAGAVLESLCTQRLAPAPPFFYFDARDGRGPEEYRRGWRLCDAMPCGAPAVVTARDGFVIARSAEALLARIAALRDPALSDDALRQRYFARSRSAKYPPGDTRGWRLAEARRRAAADDQWSTRVRRCLYRPFDWRMIYWAEWMIDWPRTAVTRHLLAGDNLALVVRRQSPAAAPCDFFWVADAPVIDGLLRSDNRGNESFFPVWRVDEQRRRQPNFAPEWITLFERATGLAWRTVDRPQRAGPGRFGPLELAGYCYALFHAPGYRTRYADALSSDFPRVLAPRGEELFRRLARIGVRLMALHLAPAKCLRGAAPPAEQAVTVEAGFPQYQQNANGEGTIRLAPDVAICRVPRAVWEFHAGAHQVCRKWLNDRRGERLEPAELYAYAAVVRAVGETLRRMHAVERTVAAAGGWSAAFV